MCAIVLLAAGCPDQTVAACGDEPASDVCGRLGFDCDTVTVCYACGVAKRIDCGQCATGQTCGGGSQAHVCWPPLDAGVDASSDAGMAAGDPDAGDASSEDAGADDGGGTDAVSDATLEGSVGARIEDAATEAAQAEPVVLCPDDAVPEDTTANGD